MARASSRYVCQVCGYEAPRWMGRCPDCGGWNTLVEEMRPAPVKTRLVRSTAESHPVPLSAVPMEAELRLRTGVAELDRVLGGGIVPGSLILLAGDPGIGKSTLMTELARYLPDRRLLYVTGEESVRQVRLRARRLGIESDNLLLLAETNLEVILEATRRTTPDVLIVDSIQTVYRPELESAPGSVSQVRESAALLMHYAKTSHIPVFLVGHVTKEGAIAGPRVLEHMVDTVLHFEGDRHHAYRILRAVKNRFGATHEIGVFEMRETGLQAVDNPSELFLSERRYGMSGSAVVCTLEGTRPVLVEIQALVTPTAYGTPQRNATGFDYRRLQMLLAVLEKREGWRLAAYDVFVNVAGGLRLEEPAADLGVLVAVASSFRDIPADTNTVLIGEVGLGGEIRGVSQLELRLREAARLGFRQALVPAHPLKGLLHPEGMEVIGVRTLHEALDFVL